MSISYQNVNSKIYSYTCISKHHKLKKKELKFTLHWIYDQRGGGGLLRVSSSKSFTCDVSGVKAHTLDVRGKGGGGTRQGSQWLVRASDDGVKIHIVVVGGKRFPWRRSCCVLCYICSPPEWRMTHLSLSVHR